MNDCKTYNNHLFLMSKYEKATIKYYENLKLSNRLKCKVCNIDLIPAVHSTKSRILKKVSNYTSLCEVRYINEKQKRRECYKCKELYY